MLTCLGWCHSTVGMLVTFLCYMSISDSTSAAFPWDDMILEVRSGLLKKYDNNSLKFFYCST